MAMEKSAATEIVGGEVLFCGSTDWSMVGRKDSKRKPDQEEGRQEMFPSLSGPHRLASLMGIKITHVASGSASCHCIALDVDGRCFTWGRNENGQLGQGDFQERHTPTAVSALSGKEAVFAASGRHHSVIVLSDGSSFAFGGNQHGQLGTGSLKSEKEKSPVKSQVSNVTAVSCGSEFSVWLTSKEGSTIMTAGLPQYGQLGHGTDNEYNAKDSSVKLVYDPQPVPTAIASLSKQTINRVASGNNHTVATDTDGFVYTWGFGGHGRLGHKEQKDEWKPRRVDTFQRSNLVPSNGVIAAGAAFSACTGGGGQLYMWGKVKSTGDNWMYPKPHMDLSGWNIRCIDCGSTSSAVGADSSCISWGTALYGELGYGPNGPKSSAAPRKVDALENTHVVGVACGLGHTLFVVSESESKDKEAVGRLPVFTPSAEVGSDGVDVVEDDKEEVSDEDFVEMKKSGGRRGGGPAKRGRGGRKGTAAAEQPKRGRGRGRGRGKK